MKRAALFHAALAAALAATACSPAIEGISCSGEEDPECLARGGRCQEGLCVAADAIPDAGACDEGRERIGAECVPSFTLEFASPAADGQELDMPLAVTVKAARAGGKTEGLPDSLVLSVAPAAGGAAVTHPLVREQGSMPFGSYQASFILERDGEYVLSTRWEAAKLEISRSVKAFGCQRQCAAGAEECVGGSCLKAWKSLELTSPADGSLHNAAASVKARLERAERVAAPCPAELALVATRGGSSTESKLLPSAAQADSCDYEASFDPAEDGSWSLVAKLAESLGGLSSAPVTALFDRAPPAVTVAFKYPQRAAPSADVKLTHAAMRPTEEYLRRDEELLLTVVASEPLDSAAPAKLLVDPGTGNAVEIPSTDWGSPQQLCPAGAAWCRVAAVPLWRSDLPMLGFNVQMSVVAVAKDRAGNSGTSEPAKVDVSRFKWAFSTGGLALQGAVAVGAKGTLFAAADSGSGLLDSGKLFVLEPSGKKLGSWDFSYLGVRPETVMVHSAAEGDSLIVAGGSLATPGLASGISIQKAAGGRASVACKEGGLPTALGPILSVALMYPESGAAPVIVGVTQSTGSWATARLLVARLDGSCDLWEPSISVPARPAVAVSGRFLYLTDDGGKVWQFELADAATGAWSNTKKSWSVSSAGSIGALAVAGDAIAGALAGLNWSSTDGAVFHFARAGGGPVVVKETAGQSVHDLAVASGGRVLAGSAEEGKDGALYIFPAGLQGAPQKLAGKGPLWGAPVAGAGGRIYGLSGTGHLAAFDPGTVAESWVGPMSQPVSRSVAATLDCSRTSDGAGGWTALPGRPGVLYSGNSGGEIVAVIADSPGIDAGAAWPTRRHDPAGTACADTPLAPYACPAP